MPPKTRSKTSEFIFSGFEECPRQAQYCLAVIVRGGEFRSADFVVPIPDRGLMVSGGMTDGAFVASPDGSHGLYAKPVKMPGGVTGVGAFSRAMGAMGNVTARVQAVKPMEIHDLLAFELTLFLRIQVRSPFVGDECFIGTPEDPLTVRLHRAEWDQHIPQLTRDGLPADVVAITEIHMAASKFKVPAAVGAGPKGAFNSLVNSRAGLPNKGTSTALRIQADAFLAQNPDYSGDDG